MTSGRWKTNVFWSSVVFCWLDESNHDLLSHLQAWDLLIEFLPPFFLFIECCEICCFSSSVFPSCCLSVSLPSSFSSSVLTSAASRCASFSLSKHPICCHSFFFSRQRKMDENLNFSCRRRNWLESFKPLEMKPWKWEFKQSFKKFVGVAIKEKFEKYETV